LIGHGSKLPYDKEVMEELKRRMQMRRVFKAVRVAFLESNLPSIEDALRTLAKDGIKSIVALPVFLAEGTHTKRDIPEKLAFVHNEMVKDYLDSRQQSQAEK
jgi:sirohydrochlorin cobaltochelatase